ncbi:MAG: hypothetical protein ACFFD1_13030, partial [Candidatus Thorarchaeota archaeon]
MAKKLVGFQLVIFVLLPIVIIQNVNPVSAGSLSVYGCHNSPSTVVYGQPVTITCSVSSSQMSDYIVSVYWTVNGGTQQNKQLTGTEPTYSTSIGSFAFGDVVTYFVRAIGEDTNYLLVSDRDPYSGSYSFTVQGQYIAWSSPANNNDVVFGPGNGPFTFSFDWSFYDIESATLDLNGNVFDIYSGGSKTTSENLYYKSDYDRDVTAILHGFKGGVEVTSDTRTFNFIWLPDFSISLTQPYEGYSYINSVPIEWQDTITNNAQISHTSTIEYSDNSGSSWHELVNGISGTSYVWNTTLMPFDTTYRVRVTSNGVYKGQSLTPTSDSSLIDFTIDPDSQAPTLIASGNVAYFIGKNGSYLTWTMYDKNPKNYSVFQDNNPIIENAQWNNNGDTVNISVEGLPLGHYEYKLTAQDKFGHKSEKTLYVDVIVPSINVSLINPTGGEIYENEINISWYVLTDSDTIYSSDLEYSNDTGVTWYPVASNLTQSFFIWNTTLFPNGSNYQIRVTVTGEYFNQSLNTAVAISNINFTINPDNEKPDIYDTGNIAYIFGKTGNYLSWTLFDRNPNNYSVLRDNNVIFNNISWTDGQVVNISVDGLIPGYYQYRIISEDKWGNKSQNDLYVNVTLPLVTVELTSPKQQNIYNDELEITWSITTEETASSSSLLEYSSDGANWFVIANNVSGNSFLWNTHLLAYGTTYRIKITVFTTYLGYNLETVTAESLETTIDSDRYAPSISHPKDVTYELGTGNNSLSWVAIDRNPFNYSISRNGEVILPNQTWISNESIDIPINGLGVGSYNYTISIEDIWGNQTTDLVVVQVRDTTSPTILILNPKEKQIFNISTGLTSITYSYVVNDLSNYKVLIMLNKTEISDIGKLENLTPGYYILNVTAVDEFGNSNYAITDFSIKNEDNNSTSSGLFQGIDNQLIMLLMIAFGGLSLALIISRSFPNLSNIL